MTNVELINLTASIASLVLSILAIVLAIYFFIQSKDAEKHVAQSLEGIRTQTQALENLTGVSAEMQVDRAPT